MKNANEVITRSFEHGAVRHRLSWFATLQGLLFLSFVLLDKSKNVMLTSLLVCAGVALCLPAIASAYTRLGIKNRLHILLAIGWVIIGTAQFVLHATT
jgi:hypothetical protein